MSPQQIPLDLLAPVTARLDNFVPGPNGAALAALRAARQGAGAQFVHLWGPPGSGRSHLLAGVAGREPCAAGEVPDFDVRHRVHVADEVQRLDAAGQARLFALQNAVRLCAGAVLVTTADLPPARLALREDVRTRLAWGLVFALRPIAEAEQAAALLAFAQARGARVDAELIPYMLSRLPRDMRTLVSVLDALDVYALERRRALTVPLLRQWLQERAAAAPPAPARGAT